MTSAEARRRLDRFGANRLVAEERLAWLKEAIGIAADPMALMLAAAATVYLLLGETTDGIIMLVALVPVLGIDIFLDARSRAALRRLAEVVAPRARALRDGEVATIDTGDVVPGDVLLLQEGDVVHADGIVRHAANLTLDESSLTGESEPQAKREVAGAPPSSDVLSNDEQVFAGSLVLAGHGFYEVTGTGATTRYGTIARLVASTSTTLTPLQRRTGWLVSRLSVVAVAVAMGVFVLGLWQSLPWTSALLGALSVAMAAIPEEFPLVLTLFLSMGAWRLSRHGMLVRNLASVETLGSTTVICTDKTGTLTAGLFVLDAHVVATPSLPETTLLEDAVLACEVHPNDAMERAIVAYAARHGVSSDRLHADHVLVADYDFDPVGRHMSHVWASVDGGATRVVAKGSLEGVLAHCATTIELRARMEAANANLAAQGMRILAVAGRSGSHAPGRRAEDERGLELRGLLGFRDPLRPEVPAAVAECQAAGIQIKMITGDHALTAHVIADASGIAHEPDAIVTGDELERLDEDARSRCAERCAIFARIAPHQKFDIVAALKRRGDIVAMTGDGINDAPALRLADIGVSMGRRGTDVARAAADLVLLDDNFASIVATVREGRRILENIQSAFLYILAFHVPIVGLALGAPLLELPLLLLPVHLVWLELVIHPVSAIVFQGEEPVTDVMQRPPRLPHEPLLPAGAAARSVAVGVSLTAAVLWAYALRLPLGESAARAFALTVLLVGCQALVWIERVALHARTRSLLGAPARSWVAWTIVSASLPLALLVPAVARILHVAPLAPGEWMLATTLGLAASTWRLAVDRWVARTQA
ncbi:MAG: cation-transporting P-type ATPase [Vicinamibacterales bacterium]